MPVEPEDKGGAGVGSDADAPGPYRVGSPPPPASVEPVARKPVSEGARKAAREAALVAAAVTALVTAASWFLPKGMSGTAVGFLFLAATWVLVWRKDDETVARFGLALGGIVMPGQLQLRVLARSLGVALAWALGFAVVIFVPYYFGWRTWWGPRQDFSLELDGDTLNDVLTNFVVVALPEEAFYRGYLQTRLDDAWPRTVRIAGAKIGIGLLLASAVFALGHFATRPYPERLAVFFPSLLFGWLRARTGGIGASLTFHALCNIYSRILFSSYGIPS